MSAARRRDLVAAGGAALMLLAILIATYQSLVTPAACAWASVALLACGVALDVFADAPWTATTQSAGGAFLIAHVAVTNAPSPAILVAVASLPIAVAGWTLRRRFAASLACGLSVGFIVCAWALSSRVGPTVASAIAGTHATAAIVAGFVTARAMGDGRWPEVGAVAACLAFVFATGATLSGPPVGPALAVVACLAGSAAFGRLRVETLQGGRVMFILGALSAVAGASLMYFGVQLAIALGAIVVLLAAAAYAQGARWAWRITAAVTATLALFCAYHHPLWGARTSRDLGQWISIAAPVALLAFVLGRVAPREDRLPFHVLSGALALAIVSTGLASIFGAGAWLIVAWAVMGGALWPLRGGAPRILSVGLFGIALLRFAVEWSDLPGTTRVALLFSAGALLIVGALARPSPRTQMADP